MADASGDDALWQFFAVAGGYPRATMIMLDQLPEIILAAAMAFAGYGFITSLFQAFDHLDAVIVRWICGTRFRG